MHRLLRTAWRWLWGLLALALIVAAVLLTTARLVLPFASDYRAEIEQHLSSYLGVPLDIGRLDVEWHGLGPRLRVEDLRIAGPPGYPSVRVDRAYVDLGLALPSYAGGLPLRIQSVSLVGIDASIQLGGDDRPSQPGQVPGGGYPVAAVIQRLFSVERLQLRQARFTIELPGASPGGAPVVLREVEIRVANEGRRHRIAIGAELPRAYGGQLHAVFDLRGPAGEYERWRGTAYVRGTDLALMPWLQRWGEALGLEGRGRGDVDLWAQWSDGGLQRLQTRTRLHDLALRSNAAEAAFERLGGHFAWTRTAHGWRIDGGDIEVARGGRSWQSGGFSLARADRGEGPPGWRGDVGFVRVEDALALARLAPLPPTLKARLEQLAAARKPHGGLAGLRFRARGRDDFALRATLQDLGWSPAGKVPGIIGLDGRLDLTPAGGTLVLATADASLRAPRLFRGPLPLAELRGRVELIREDAGMRIRMPRLQVANPDVEAVGRVDVRLPAGGDPRIDMQFDFAKGDLTHISRYLPVGAMDPKAVEWLDRSVISGQVVDGRMLWRGSIAGFPYQRPGGIFEVRMEIADARLNYAPGWPGHLQASGRVRVSGHSLDVQLDRGQLFDTQITSLKAHIADFAEPHLTVRAGARGPLSDLLHVVNDGPLQERLGAFLGGARADGAAGLDLNLAIPLQRPEQARVDVRVGLTGNRFAQPRFGMDLEALKGDVHYADGRLTIAGLSARLAGQPIRIDARTRPAPDKTLLIGVQGDLGAAALLPALPDAFAQRIEGRAPWRLHVQVPFERGQRERPILVHGTSSLLGTAIDLPAPLGKAADQRRPLHFELPIAGDGELGAVRVSYGGALQAVLAITGHRGDLHLERGRIRLGDGPVPKLAADATGIRLRGRIAQLDLGGWADLLRAGGVDETSDWDAVGLAGADLQIGQTTYRGYSVSDLQVTATREAASWRVAIDSSAIAGRVRIPVHAGDEIQPLVVRLARLDWSALTSGKVQGEAPAKGAGTDTGGDAADAIAPDLAALPPLDLHIGRLKLEAGTLHNVVLATEPLPHGLAIRQADFENPHLSVKVSGRWRGGAEAQSTAKLSLYSDNLGAALEAFGYGGIFARTEGQVTADLQWPGAPWSPTLAKTEGQIEIDLHDGVLKAFDPGLARLFAVFDIRGLLQSGFQLDELEGQIGLAHGYASTEDLKVEGSVGQLRVHGRTDLIAQALDFTIAFRPQLSRSLPLIGVLSGGPATGLAVALVQGVLRTIGADMERAAQLTYTLTGTWDDPKVEPVGGSS